MATFISRNLLIRLGSELRKKKPERWGYTYTQMKLLT
jgi:hypothetical protein